MLGREDMAAIEALANRKSYRDGETIHEHGDRTSQVGLVVSGKIKLVYPRSDGNESFSGVIHPGQNYGDAALIHGEARMHRAIAVGGTVIDHLTAEAFARLLERSTITRALYLIASYRLSVCLDLLDDMRMLSPQVRFAKLVLRMREASGGAERLQYLQGDFASMLGISNVTLAKVLRKFESLGLVQSGYRHLIVPDPALLRAWIAEQDVG